MNVWENLKIAFNMIANAKLRSMLTMLGIIIGVASVVTVISIGEGVKGQVSNEISDLGKNLINITPGKTFAKDEEGNISGFNPTASFGTSTLTEKDLETVRKTEGIEAAAPIMIISGVASTSDKELAGATIIATNSDYPSALNQEVINGNFFSQTQTGNVAVVGKGIADDFFSGSDAISGVLKIRGEKYIIVGVMEEFSSVFGSFGPDLNKSIYIPLEAGKEFNQGVAQIVEIDAKVQESGNVNEVINRIEKRLTENHGGESDFTVLKQEDLITVTSTVFSLLTTFVAAIAAISLVVGGIGIMNIMLVSVTERTREIGLRKAVGATNIQILGQFLIEAVVLSIIGGFLGVAVAYAIVAFVTLFTDISGSFALNTIYLATGVSGGVGIIFGIMPAIKAALKNPIDALRYE